ncbi:glycosyltransferase family 2 protein [Pedobacter sp. 22226]|uniref:glycosyltransferase family 2 protein n=1 Tax=Pedobacter sp. 22226 TaxID=3453894 RepID=UPI003F8584D5
MITILVPTYNCGKYIYKCIKSVLSQSYIDYELLIIDDGSTDDTEKIVKAISDKRITYLKNAKNLGVIATLNKGVQLAKGKYIARMDADDLITGNRLQTQVDFLERNPEFGMVGSWYRVMDESEKVMFEVRNYTNPDFLKLGLVFTNHFAHPAVMMRTKLAKKLLYDKDFKHCEDHELWTRFAEVKKVTNLPFFFLHVRSHAKGTCNLNQKDLKISVIKLLSRELNKKGIKHTPEELMLHASICFGSSKKLAQECKKAGDLKKWLEKIFASPYIRKNFTKEILDKFKADTMQNAGLN